MALRGKGEVICDVDHAVVAEAQEILRLFQLLFTDVGADGYAGLLLKEPGKVAGGEAGMGHQGLDGNALPDMLIDIIDAHLYGTGGMLVGPAVHPLRVIKHHPVVKLRDGLRGLQAVQLPDIKVA